MKKKYESPQAEVIDFDIKDIMMTDSTTPKPGDWDQEMDGEIEEE